MTGVIKAMLGVAFVLVVALVIMAAVFLPGGDDSSFRPNGKTILAGAVVCPDTVGARSEFHKGIEAEKALNEIAQSHDTKMDKLDHMAKVLSANKADFSPYGCSEIESGVPVYIESEDAIGIATITAKLPDETLLHGITYASEVQSDAPRK
jgi:hypothetical protein